MGKRPVERLVGELQPEQLPGKRIPTMFPNEQINVQLDLQRTRFINNKEKHDATRRDSGSSARGGMYIPPRNWRTA
jgi:hypothetical protein